MVRRIIYRLMLSCIIMTAVVSCSSSAVYGQLQKSLEEYVADKDATIGVAVVVDGKPIVAVNGDRAFPMLSVYKFPIALALADNYRQRGVSLDVPVEISKADLHTDTYSPMTEKILASSTLSTGQLTLPTDVLLGYMLQESDNNASDIVLRCVGGACQVDKYLSGIGVNGVSVRNSEDEMHRDISLCYSNSATPAAMAQLMDKFNKEFDDSLSLGIKQLMETCVTGTNRLVKPLGAANIVIGHKTGTGFILPDGRIMAVNDAGYVNLPDGQRYAIAVFVENSAYDMAATEEIVAEISRMVLYGIMPR